MLYILLVFIVLSAPLLIIPLTWWSIEWGITAVIILLPTYLLRSEPIAGIPTTGLELTIYGLAIGAVLHWSLRGGWQRPRFSRSARIILSCWILAWAIATLFSADVRASLGAVKAWLFDPLVLTFIVYTVIRTEGQQKKLLQALALSGTVVALGGLLQYVAFPDSIQDGRLSSFYAPVANYAAMYLAPILVVTLGGLLSSKLHRTWWSAVIVMTIALAMTVSFGGYLALGVGLFVLWLQLANQRLRRWLALTAISVAVLGVGILSTTSYLKEKINFTDRSSSLVRTQIWRTSIEMIKDHPIVGIGPNAFEGVYRETIPRLYFPPLEWLVAQPHQLYLALWLETGVLGLIVFVVGITMWLRSLWSRFRQHEGIVVTAVAGLVAILVHGFVDTPIFKNDLMVITMIIIVLPFLHREEQFVTKN